MTTESIKPIRVGDPIEALMTTERNGITAPAAPVGWVRGKLVRYTEHFGRPAVEVSFGAWHIVVPVSDTRRPRGPAEVLLRCVREMLLHPGVRRDHGDGPPYSLLHTVTAPSPSYAEVTLAASFDEDRAGTLELLDEMIANMAERGR